MTGIVLELTVTNVVVAGDITAVTAEDDNGALSTVFRWCDETGKTPEKGATVYLELQYEPPEVVT